MAKSGVPRLDSVLDGTDSNPIISTDDALVIGAIQDLLGGHDFRNMPSLQQKHYGRFGHATAQAIVDFQKQRGLPHAEPESVPSTTGSGKKKKKRVTPILKPESVKVDQATLQRLLEPPVDEPKFHRKAKPRFSRVYVTQQLNQTWGMMVQCAVLSCLFEGAGLVWYPNRNGDYQGLSFGLLHWAQGQGRLGELVDAMKTADETTLRDLMGGATKLQGLIADLARADHGVFPKTDPNHPGETKDPAFDLVKAPWLERFRQTCLRGVFQKAQLELGLVSYRANYAKLKAAVLKPGTTDYYIHSERGMTFFIDIANQHGVGVSGGGAGAIPIFEDALDAATTAGKPTDEATLMPLMVEESVKRLDLEFQDGTRTRREFFRKALRDNVEFVDP
jgi:hypothetical protein